MDSKQERPHCPPNRSTIEDILNKCSWKIAQENNEPHFLRCYQCDGSPERANILGCKNYTLGMAKNGYKRHLKPYHVPINRHYRHD
jgi:hypothetical protein